MYPRNYYNYEPQSHFGALQKCSSATTTTIATTTTTTTTTTGIITYADGYRRR